MPTLMPGQEYPSISDYALISDMHSCGLVSRSGSIDWCCFPRFDGAAIFSRLLDWQQGGYFEVAPEGVRSVSRRYLPETNILETTFETESGRATLTDFMPVHPHPAPPRFDSASRARQIMRILRCVKGHVRFRLVCRPRFDYGTILPHVQLINVHSAFAHGGAEAISILCSAPLEIVDHDLRCQGSLRAGESVCAAVTFEPREPHRVRGYTSHELAAGGEPEFQRRLNRTRRFWKEWAALCTYDGQQRDEVIRSALTLKALTYAPSGALVAAPTTSLPEEIGGTRNWDYRFTWVRDATFALYALFIIGYTGEAKAFKDWLEWSTAGHPDELQLMYGLGGERRLTEIALGALDGYRGSRPVRIGNAAYGQFQLDIYGELLDSAHLYRKYVGGLDAEYWNYLREVVGFVLRHWREPDEGIWETRSERQHFLFSKVMCWVAVDRAIKAAEALGMAGEVQEWKKARAEMREEILARGYDAERGAFVQAFGSKCLDASVLMLPLVGFIRVDDPRMRSTVEVVERELTSPEGFVYRYRGYDDGIEEAEGAFVMCTFWLVDNLIALGRMEDARALYDKVRGCANDVGLFSEEVHPGTGEMRGNFPQAFSHLSFINATVQFHKAIRGEEDSLLRRKGRASSGRGRGASGTGDPGRTSA